MTSEFLDELLTRGRIYGYRYRPEGEIKDKPVEEYKGILEARAIQLMIDNNLDFDIALYPYELVTSWPVMKKGFGPFYMTIIVNKEQEERLNI